MFTVWTERKKKHGMGSVCNSFLWLHYNNTQGLIEIKNIVLFSFLKFAIYLHFAENGTEI